MEKEKVVERKWMIFDPSGEGKMLSSVGISVQVGSEFQCSRCEEHKDPEDVLF